MAEEPGWRARRALALMGLALIALGAAAGLYLRSSHAGPDRATPRPTPVQPVLAALDWLSIEVGWVALSDPVSHRTVLFRTTDGGRHWERQFAMVGGLLGLRFLDPYHGLLQESPVPPNATGALLASSDAGAHWAPIALPAETDRLPGTAFFTDRDHGWVAVTHDRGSQAQDLALYRTDDGGLDWIELARVDPAHPASHGIEEGGLKGGVWFRDARDGWMGGLEADGSASVYVTHDGGDSWRKVRLPEPPGGWNAGDARVMDLPRFSDDGRGALLLVDTNRLNAVLGDRSPRAPVPPAVAVYLSPDGGDTWQDPRPAPPGADPRLGGGLAFTDGYAGWLAGGGTIWVTADTGRSWARQSQLPADWSLAGITPVNGSVAVAQAATSPPTVFGDFPWRLLVTEDGGRAWRPLDAPRLG